MPIFWRRSGQNTDFLLRDYLAGLIIRPHKPPAAGGCVFFSLEDETALCHVTVVPEVYQKIGPVVFGGGMVVVTGRAERRGEGVSLLAEEVAALC